MAAHTNDPAAHLHEILMYNSVIEYVKGYVKKTNTVMVSTSDHETGGLSLGYQPGIPYPEYKWNPLFLKNIKKSSEYLAKKVMEVDRLQTLLLVLDKRLLQICLKQN